MRPITVLDKKSKEHKAYKKNFVNRIALYGFYVLRGKILLVKDVESNRWEIPGGGKEKNETEFECLKREFFEETGFIIKNNPLFIKAKTTYFYDLEHKEFWKTKRKFYIVDVEKGKIKINRNEISDVMFTKIEHTQTLNIDPIAITIPKQIHKDYNIDIVS